MTTIIPALKGRVASAIRKRVIKSGFYFRHEGFCPCCKTPATFLARDPWLRDSFQCTACGSIPRNRALLRVLEMHYPGWAALSIHESSPSVGGASARLQADCGRYLASQYHPGHSPGSLVGHFRNEDLEHQTFANEAFDIVITQDVLEHVYDPARVFSEIARTLKPGGSHVFCVPLVNKFLPSKVWATRNADGSPNFLHEPDYHGNPVDPRGSPVTMHWGYDIVNFIRDASGLETTIESIDDLRLGIRAEYNEVLVTTKPLA